jgi:hypothetical protein
VFRVSPVLFKELKELKDSVSRVFRGYKALRV